MPSCSHGHCPGIMPSSIMGTAKKDTAQIGLILKLFLARAAGHCARLTGCMQNPHASMHTKISQAQKSNFLAGRWQPTLGRISAPLAIPPGDLPGTACCIRWLPILGRIGAHCHTFAHQAICRHIGERLSGPLGHWLAIQERPRARPFRRTRLPHTRLHTKH